MLNFELEIAGVSLDCEVARLKADGRGTGKSTDPAPPRRLKYQAVHHHGLLQAAPHQRPLLFRRECKAPPHVFHIKLFRLLLVFFLLSMSYDSLYILHMSRYIPNIRSQLLLIVLLPTR